MNEHKQNNEHHEKRKRFVLKRELDFGDILTACSILVSVLALGFAWLHDQTLKSQAYADEIRKSTAAVTGKLERWTQLSDLYFEDVMPRLVPVSEKAAKSRKREPANGDLYKGLQEANLKASERISQEELEISYMELYRYVPELQTPFDETISAIKKTEADSRTDLAAALQDQLPKSITGEHLDACYTGSDSTSPQIPIGNDLRCIVYQNKEQTHEEIQKKTSQLRAQMLCVIKLPDGKLRDSPKRTDAVRRILVMNEEEIKQKGCPK